MQWRLTSEHESLSLGMSKNFGFYRGAWSLPRDSQIPNIPRQPHGDGHHQNWAVSRQPPWGNQTTGDLGGRKRTIRTSDTEGSVTHNQNAKAPRAKKRGTPWTRVRRGNSKHFVEFCGHFQSVVHFCPMIFSPFITL